MAPIYVANSQAEMPDSIRLLFLIACLAMTCSCPGQRVVLPGGTGGVTPSESWVVLRGTELEADERATDPSSEPARSRLMATIRSLRRDRLTDQHLLLHSEAGSGERRTTRLIQAYSAPGGATAGELRGRTDSIREVLERELSAGGDEATFSRSGLSSTFDEGAVELLFELDGDGRALTHAHFLVPAGERIQYFDASWDREDAGGEEAVRALLATFDGRADPPRGAGNLWIAGVAGALAGVVTALARRKRQARLLSAGNS